MKEKTDLEIIQLVSNILRIICKVLAIVCRVLVAIFAVVFVIFLLAGILKWDIDGHDPAQGVGICLVGAELAAVAAFIFKMAQTYFTKELEDGTPFTMDGALLFRRLGILDAIISLCSGIVASIILAIFKCDSITFGIGTSVWTGLLIIAISYIFSYGASLNQSEKTQDEN